MKLSIVIPCYNEAKDIVNNVKKVKDYLLTHNIEHELILVNDGSKDNTKEVISSIPDVMALSYDKNRGKGGAVKYGIEHATGDYVLFMDADLSTDLTAIEKTLELIPQYDFVLGSRHAKTSVIKKKQPALRVFIGWGCRVIVNMLFHLKLKDTQCGFKAIRTDIAKQIVAKQLVTNFAFDVEYIYIAKLNRISMYELGITWQDDRGSTVSPLKSSIKFFKDLAFIRKNRRNYYFYKDINNVEFDNYCSKCGQIVLSSALILVLITLFLVFIFTQNVNNYPSNSSQHDNSVNERFNNKLIDIIEQQMEDSGFTTDEVTAIKAVTIEENYPTNFSLSIACFSEDNVYIYQLADYPYLNVTSSEDNAVEYLLNHDEFTDDEQDVIMVKYQLIDETNSNDKTRGYITYSNRFSGYYLYNNVYQIYFDQINSNADPFVGANFASVNQSNPLFGYYAFLNK